MSNILQLPDVARASLTTQLVERFAPDIMEKLAPALRGLNDERKRGVGIPVGLIRDPIIVAEYQSQQTAVLMFYLTIQFTDEMLVSELADIVSALDCFGSYVHESFTLGSFMWTLGDPDDTQAIIFKDGKLAIWLRGWE